MTARFDDERERAFVVLAVRCKLDEPDAVVNAFEHYGQWRASALYCGRVIEYVIGGTCPNFVMREVAVTTCPVCAEDIGTGATYEADDVQTFDGVPYTVHRGGYDGCESCARHAERLQAAGSYCEAAQ